MAVAMSMLLVDRRDDDTALITINRAGQAFLRDLPATIAALDEDPGVHACVIPGLDEAFSASGESRECGERHCTPGALDGGVRPGDRALPNEDHRRRDRSRLRRGGAVDSRV